MFWLTSYSILLHFQICPCLVDGPSSDRVRLLLKSSEDLDLLKLNHVAAHKWSFAPSSNPSSRATSRKVAPQLPTSVLKLIKQLSLTFTESGLGTYSRVDPNHKERAMQAGLSSLQGNQTTQKIRIEGLSDF